MHCPHKHNMTSVINTGQWLKQKVFFSIFSWCGVFTGSSCSRVKVDFPPSPGDIPRLTPQVLLSWHSPSFALWERSMYLTSGQAVMLPHRNIDIELFMWIRSKISTSGQVVMLILNKLAWIELLMGIYVMFSSAVRRARFSTCTFFLSSFSILSTSDRRSHSLSLSLTGFHGS